MWSNVLMMVRSIWFWCLAVEFLRLMMLSRFRLFAVHLRCVSYLVVIVLEHSGRGLLMNQTWVTFKHTFLRSHDCCNRDALYALMVSMLVIVVIGQFITAATSLLVGDHCLRVKVLPGTVFSVVLFELSRLYHMFATIILLIMMFMLFDFRLLVVMVLWLLLS